MDADFHCFGTIDEDNDRFSTSANGGEKNGEPICRNQAGMLSSPVAVDGRVSRILNIRHSQMCEHASTLLVVTRMLHSRRFIISIS